MSESTDYNGAVVEDKILYPWGQDWQTAGTLYEERFAKLQHRDSETSLDPTPNRMFSSTFGRWLSPDPLFGSVANPQSLNRYDYVTDNPANRVDPDGRCGDDGDCDPVFGYDFGLGFGPPVVSVSVSTDSARKAYRFTGSTFVGEFSFCSYEACDQAPDGDPLAFCNKRRFSRLAIFLQTGRTDCPKGFVGNVYAVSVTVSINLPFLGSRTFSGGGCAVLTSTFGDHDPCVKNWVPF